VPELLAGTARLSLEPPLDLPMVGFVRQGSHANGYGRFGLETTAIGLVRDGTRVVLCGVDIVGIGEPEISHLLDRVAAATGAAPAGILLNWNHTHLSPLAGFWGAEAFGPPDEERDARVRAFADVIQDKIVSVCRLAFEQLEPVRPVWGIGEAELAVNRRERAADGTTILGWNPENLIDNRVTTLQLRRADESAVATLVSFGCHTVTTGFDMTVYSADFPGAIRELVRRTSGGECVYFQGAGGNVLPKVAFTDDEGEADRMGTRIALEALHAVADRFATPNRMVWKQEESVMPISAYRREAQSAEPPQLAATMEHVRFPLLPHPTPEEVRAVRAEWEPRVAEARAAGDVGRTKVAWYHAAWARKIEQQLLDGTAPTFNEGRIHAVRIGDGVIATGPGETFTEIGMAVKERGPGVPTLYCGYTNGLVSYFPTAAEYRYGGYEADYGCRSVGNPSHVAPECEQILVETAVRAAEQLFPEAEPWPSARGWTASGALPVPLGADPLPHPSKR
jgi:neutral ceramidase